MRIRFKLFWAFKYKIKQLKKNMLVFSIYKFIKIYVCLQFQ